MTVAEKMKTIDNKTEQTKAQHDLHRQTAKISALSSGNVSKYGFLTDKDVLPPKKSLLGKPATIKRFEYSPLCSEVRKKISVAEKQYQKLEKVFEPNKKEEDKKKKKKKLC